MHRNITFKRMALDIFQFFRAQKAATGLLGPQFSRSHEYVEIDMTYRCNIRCHNCNRSCTQAPSTTDISFDRITAFLEQSIYSGIRWKRIRLLGGEPTLHPKITMITDKLMAYKVDHSPKMRIVLCTNGAGQRVGEVLSRLPGDIVIKSTAKGKRQRLFRPFNSAPIDSVFYRFADFAAGCRILKDCGIGLTPSGYYACAIAGGIDRVFGFQIARQQLPSPSDDMRDQLVIACRYCGHFGFLWPTRQQKTSPSWDTAYRKYHQSPSGDALT